VASPQKEDYHEPRPHSPPGCKRLVQHARHSLRQPALRYTIRRRVTQGRVILMNELLRDKIHRMAETAVVTAETDLSGILHCDVEKRFWLPTTCPPKVPGISISRPISPCLASATVTPFTSNVRPTARS
jgi:hypothetical protein